MVQKNPSRKGMTKKQQLADSVRRFREGRPPGDRKYPRARDDRKIKIRRKPNGEPSSGGWRGDPNSLTALALHREKGQVQNRPKCQRPGGCTQIPVKGSKFCRWHGGQKALHKRRQADPMYRPKQSTILKNEINRLLADGVVPLELQRQDLFRVAITIALRSKHPPKDMPGAERVQLIRRWFACSQLVLEFIGAWQSMEDDDHQPWHTAVGKARALGLGQIDPDTMNHDPTIRTLKKPV